MAVQVKSHTRNGKKVRAYTRGGGMLSSLASKVKGLFSGSSKGAGAKAKVAAAVAVASAAPKKAVKKASGNTYIGGAAGGGTLTYKYKGKGKYLQKASGTTGYVRGKNNYTARGILADMASKKGGGKSSFTIKDYRNAITAAKAGKFGKRIMSDKSKYTFKGGKRVRANSTSERNLAKLTRKKK